MYLGYGNLGTVVFGVGQPRNPLFGAREPSNFCILGMEALYPFVFGVGEPRNPCIWGRET
jgi:hypothetical protein